MEGHFRCRDLSKELAVADVQFLNRSFDVGLGQSKGHRVSFVFKVDTSDR
jgi:hypothetical protein